MAFKSSYLTMLLGILMWIINNVEGSPTGVKINDIKYCGPTDKTWKFKVRPWPVLTLLERFYITVTFTPAVDVLAVSSIFEIKYLENVKIATIYTENACPLLPKMCSLPANVTQTLEYSDQLTDPLIGPQGSYTVTMKFYNQVMVMWQCFTVSGELF